MTRRSKRELEREVEGLAAMNRGAAGKVSDAQLGVTAEFVTFQDGDPIDEDDIPDGWEASTTTGRGGITYHIVERTDERGDQQ